MIFHLLQILLVSFILLTSYWTYISYSLLTFKVALSSWSLQKSLSSSTFVSHGNKENKISQQNNRRITIFNISCIIIFKVITHNTIYGHKKFSNWCHSPGAPLQCSAVSPVQAWSLQAVWPPHTSGGAEYFPRMREVKKTLFFLSRSDRLSKNTLNITEKTICKNLDDDQPCDSFSRKGVGWMHLIRKAAIWILVHLEIKCNIQKIHQEKDTVIPSTSPVSPDEKQPLRSLNQLWITPKKAFFLKANWKWMHQLLTFS